MDNITDFLKHMITETGITDKGFQDKAINELEPILYDRLTLGLISKLDKKGQNKVVDLLNNHKPDLAINYLKNNIQNFDIEYEKLLVQFAGEYLQKMKE